MASKYEYATDEELFGISSETFVPEEEMELDRQVVEGESSNIVGGFMSGLQGVDWMNLPRIARANLTSETLKKYSWLANAFWKGDNLSTEATEEGWNWESPMEQIGVTDDEWDKMSPTARITALKSNAVSRTDEYFNVDKDSVGYMVSSLAGNLASPSLALTMAKPLAAVTYGVADAALYSAGEDGKIDATTVAIGGAAGGAVSKGIQIFNKSRGQKVLTAVESEMNRIAAASTSQGKLNSGPALVVQARKNLGIDSDAFDAALDIRVKKKGVNGELIKPTKASATAAFEMDSLNQVVKRGSSTAIGKGIDYIIEPISEGIKRISPRAFGKLKQVERELFEDAHTYATMVDPFLNKAFRSKALTTTQQNKLWLDMSNASSKKDVKAIEKFLKESNPKGTVMVNDFRLYREAMDNIHAQRVKVGNTKLQKIEGYSPRKIINNKRWYKGAKESERSAINKILVDKYDIDPAKATDATLQKAISQYLKSTSKKNVRVAGSSKARVKETLTSKQLDSYQKPWQATHAYIKESMEEVQRYKVFGTKNIAEDGDLTETIASFVAQEHKAKRISGNDIDSLKDLLQARFINGPKSMNNILKGTKDIGYMTLLGHPSNAIRQFGDLAASMYVNGIRNAMKGAYSALKPGKLLSAKDSGLLDNVAEEFASDTVIRRGVDTMFKYSGFRSIDALGKGALLNSSIYKAASQLKTGKGSKEFMNEWSAIFGANDAAKVASDFQAFNKGTLKEPTALMKDIAFIKLSKIQPVTLSEMPRGYLNNPNGRMMYMLQSFTLKHINTIRQDVFKQMASTNPREIAKGVKNLGKLGAYYTAMNVGADLMIDAMLGRDKRIDETIITNMYRSTGFITKYDVDQMVRDGDIYEGWLSGVVMPPLQQMSKGTLEAGQIALNLAQGKRWSKGMKNPGKDMWQNIPIIGRLMANWLY
jgi:hypothetical protein|tara:strand:- start:88 stop:2889 length:2802 start_codon:yes stop_codon:yes gene_type:complete